MTCPKISVILPIYNSSQYLRDTLKSITAQTFVDWELIAIDDGSTDDSLKILREYSETEPRLIIVSRENKGLPRTLNEGIRLAKGEWIARIDADDICLPQRFQRQLEWLKNTKCDICGTWYKEFGKYNHVLYKQPVENDDIYFRLHFENPLGHPTVMVRTSVLRSFLYDETKECSQDYDLWCRMAVENIKMTNLPEVLLYYRTSENQITSKKSGLQKSHSKASAMIYLSKSPLKHILKSFSEYRILSEATLQGLFKGIAEIDKLIEAYPKYEKYLSSFRNLIFVRITGYGLLPTLRMIKLVSNISILNKLILIVFACLKIYHFKKYIYGNSTCRKVSLFLLSIKK